MDFTKEIEELRSLYKSYDEDALMQGNTKENGLLHLYSFYYYGNGDPDNILDIAQNVNYNPSNGNVMHGFLNDPNADESTLDILCIYPTETKFDRNAITEIVTKAKIGISEVRQGIYSVATNTSKLKEYYDRYSNDKVNIKVITNYSGEDNAKINEIISNTLSNDTATVEVIFGNDIKDLIEESNNDKENVDHDDLELFNCQSILKYENAAVVNISAKSLKELYAKYGKQGLFADNLRFYIKSNKVDPKIVDSMQKKPEEFWYKNNGIIMLCDSFEIDIENQIVHMNKFSIVNGGQTTALIGQNYFPEDFGIICKLIQRRYDDPEKNEQFIADVAEASNTQKPIKAKDLIANRVEQRMMRQQLREIDVCLIIKNGEKAPDKNIFKEKWQVGKNDEMAQLLYSFVYQNPGIARNNKDSLFSDSKKYKTIFGPHYDSYFLRDLLALRTFYDVYKKNVTKELKNNKSKEAATKLGLLKNGMYFTIAIIGALVKLHYSKEMRDDLTNNFAEHDKVEYYLKALSFNHKVFKNLETIDIDDVKRLFDFIYERFFSRAFDIVLGSKPDYAYSNFTKINSNYTTYVYRGIRDYVVDGGSPALDNLLSKLLYTENNTEITNELSSYNNYKQLYETSKNPGVEGDTDDQKLAGLLTIYRTNTYKENKIKAYNVFTNDELKNLVKYKPTTKDDLKKYQVFTSDEAKKIYKYGDDIVRIINEFVNKTN